MQLAQADLGLDHELGHQGHAHAGDSRLDDHRQLLEARPRQGIGAVHADMAEPVLPCLRARGVLQERDGGQVFDRVDALAQGLAAHRHHLFAHQAHHHRIGPVGFAEVDGRIHLTGTEIEGQDLGTEVEQHIRMGGGKLGQARDQPLHAEGRQDGQVQHAGQAVVGHHLEGRHLDLLEDGGNLGCIVTPGLGEDESAVDAFEELDVEVVLQDRHLPAHRALRHVQLVGRLGKRHVPRRGIKGDQA